jgi:hypothetical protein
MLAAGEEDEADNLASMGVETNLMLFEYQFVLIQELKICIPRTFVSFTLDRWGTPFTFAFQVQRWSKVIAWRERIPNFILVTGNKVLLGSHSLRKHLLCVLPDGTKRSAQLRQCWIGLFHNYGKGTKCTCQRLLRTFEAFLTQRGPANCPASFLEPTLHLIRACTGGVTKDALLFL